MTPPGVAGTPAPAREPRLADVAAGGHSLRIRLWEPAPHPGRDGEGPSLLLVHGFMGSGESWVPLVERLPETWRIVAVDLPGHGGSPPGEAGPEPGYAIPAVARLLGQLQDRLLPGPAWWLGYSMGGRIALSASVQGVPQAGLLLESASVGIRGEAERTARRAADEARARRLEALGTASGGRDRRGMAAFVEAWLSLPLFAGLGSLAPGERERAVRIRSGQDPLQMARWLREGGAGVQPWYGGDLSRIPRTVHVLVGADDGRYVSLWTGLAARHPGVRVTTAPGSGHLPHLENPAAWAAWVRGALG